MFTSSHVVRENVLATPAIYAINPKIIINYITIKMSVIIKCTATNIIMCIIYSNNYYYTYSPVYNFFSPQKKSDVLKVIKLHDADRTINIKTDKS